MQWLMLVFTLLVMTVLRRLARGGPLEARATLALGFLIIAAYLGGEIARRFRLPRITGYLLAGFLVGPPWLALVREEELQVLHVIWTGAVALIGFAAGNELRFSALRANLRLTWRLAAVAMAIPFAAVTLVVLSISPWFPLTAHQPFGDAATVALLLGGVAAVSSPIVTWGLISDVGDRSVLGRILYHVTILQAAVALLLVTVLLAIANPVASGGAVTPMIAVRAALYFVGSLAAGALLGMGIAYYARVIRAHTTLVLLAAAFFVAQGVRLLELEPVLMALAGGAVLANTAQAESDQVRAALERCMVPIYVVFFALVGADLRLGVLGELWPWAVLLIGLRITGLWGGFRLVGRLRAVQQTDGGAALVGYGWLGLITQGALAISFAAVLRRAFPEWGITLESLIVAMIGVQLIAGPICFHWLLQKRPGDVPEGAHETKQGEMGAAGAALARSTGVS